MSKNKVTLSTAATVALGLVSATSGVAHAGYVAGDMHNHNTCTDGSVQVGYAIDRSVGTGTFAAGGGNNFNLDWFTLGNHGGSGNRDCRFSDASAKVPGDGTTTFWSQTLGQTIQGITISSLKGTPSGTGTNSQMWRWQNIREVEYPILNARRSTYASKLLVEGLEWIVPGHEHADVAIITGQFPSSKRVASNADAMAEFEFRFDAADADKIGPVDASNNPIWTGKDTVNNSGTAGHDKAVNGVKWLQANFPLASYAVPTHTERKGPFNPSSNKGWNIEHFRDFNNAGPTVAFGIEAPGHAAQGTKSGGSGSYDVGTALGDGTYGMSGIYTAKVGGLWDGLLGEGRNVFVYASSDWHNRGAGGFNDSFTTGDFLPGEYTKLYVPGAFKMSGQKLLDGMRSGNSYSVNGDLIGPNLRYILKDNNTGTQATMGQTLVVNKGDTVIAMVILTVPAKNNSPYSFANPLLKQVGITQPLNQPSLDHIDLITGDVTGVVPTTSPFYAVPNTATTVYNASAKIAKQLQASKAVMVTNPDGSIQYTFRTTFKADSDVPFYVRLRGTNLPVATPNATDASGNPLLDLNNAKVICSDAACPAHLDTDASGNKLVSADVQAYSNLWFYANPIFVRTASTPKLLVETNADLAASLK